MDGTITEEFVTPLAKKRESKPGIQLRSPFLNSFGSSSEKYHENCYIWFEEYPFRLELDTDLYDEAQKVFDEFIYQGFKHGNK